MREVQIVRWCDGEHREPAPAEVSRTIVLDGGEALILDLCAEHDREFFDPLIALLEFAAPVRENTGKKGAANTVCPKCGFKSATRQGLSQHLRARHGTGLRAAKA